MGKRVKLILAAILLLLLLGSIFAVSFYFVKRFVWKQPDELLEEYMGYITQKEYGKMYEMIDWQNSRSMSKEEFIERNANIYEGIEAENMQIEIVEKSNGGKKIIYICSFDTVAGAVSFKNKADFTEGKSGYALIWDDHLIFPSLESSDKVRVSEKEAKRGNILDRNGLMLAGEGVASSVGIVPMNMEDRESEIEEIAMLLDIDKETIENKLSAEWVKEDYFVPVKTLPKVHETDLMAAEPDEDVLLEQQRQEALLEIPGVMISDVKVREYPLKEAAAHLVGYVQSVTAEDLEEHEGEGYHANSVIGRSGMESLFEKELKGQDGCEIYIEDDYGSKKLTVAEIPVQNGQDIRLTIDSQLQKALYEQFKEDKSCSVAVDPYLGEVLALVSTPSYDNNDFILGMSNQKWEALNEDERNPLYNRFRQVWCPGSTLKPIVAAIGLRCGVIEPQEDFGNEGLSWQKDQSWGDYYITTLHAYDHVILENALIYSDNIYFAKAALKIGAEELIQSFKNLGFGSELPFEIKMAQSQYSNTDTIDSEIQLADSGYGQGQILMNPLHLAVLYSAFCNQGDVIQPRLIYQEQAEAVTWLSKAFPNEVIEEVLKGMEKVINDPNGTGYGAYREDIALAGKTGTAEIKTSKEDSSGTELGWLAIFTTDPDIETPILLVSMVEDVKDIGGSSYVVNKDKAVLDIYLK